MKILCLHGYHGSALFMRRQLAPLADGLDELVELVCIDAPTSVSGKHAWWRAVAVDNAAVPTDPGVGRGTKRYEAWPRTLDAIRAAFRRQGPFDGVLGFSQGAALAALLVGLRSRDGSSASGPDATAQTASSEPPLDFDFAVMIGGFASADSDLARLYDERANYDLPSVHMIGRSDAAVPREASLALASRFKDPLILEHEGGHVIPHGPPIRQAFRTFLEEMQRRRASSRIRPDIQ